MLKVVFFIGTDSVKITQATKEIIKLLLNLNKLYCKMANFNTTVNIVVSSFSRLYYGVIDIVYEYYDILSIVYVCIVVISDSNSQFSCLL